MATTSRAKRPSVADMIIGDNKLEEFKEPTREDVFNAAFWVAANTNRVPTLVGPTASGKTWGVHALAEQHNAEVVTVLLGQHTPDEIAGFQLNIDGQLVVQMPYWFRKAQEIIDSGKNAFILFDELGLSREEVRGALYTFFRDRHLHGHALSSNENTGSASYLFAASNPAVFAPPFRSRCVFLHVPADRAYLIDMAKTPYAKKASLGNLTFDKESAYSNTPPPPPETVDASAIAALNAINSDFWRMTTEARYLVLQGLVPAATLADMLAVREVDMSALSRDIKELGNVLSTVPRDQRHGIINSVIETFPNLTPEETAEALIEILDRIYDDLSTQDLELYFSTPRSDMAVRAVMDIEVDYIERRLKERGMLWVETKRGGDKQVVGSILTRVEKMIELKEKQDSK